MLQDRAAEIVAPFICWRPRDMVVVGVGEVLEFLYDVESGEPGDADAFEVVHCGKVGELAGIDEGAGDFGSGGEGLCGDEVVGALGG